MATTASGKVLLVDDDSRLAFVVSSYLKHAGFEVRTAENGREGVEAALEYAPDVIVMDLTMPVMDGMEATSALKQNAKTKRIPIIILTGNARTENLVLGLETGAQDYIVKPFDIEELVARVRSTYRMAVTERELDRLNDQLSSEIERKTRQLGLLYNLTNNLNKASTQEEIFDLVVSTAQQATDSARISLLLRDDSGEELVCRRAVGIRSDLVERIRIKSIEGIAGKVYSSGQAVCAKVLAGSGAPRDGRYASTCFLSAPIILNSERYGREVLGVLNVTEKSNGDPFADEDVACIQSIADSAAIAIHNQITRNRLEHSVEVLLMTVGRLAEYRDEETTRHLERVQEYVRLLATKLAESPTYGPVLTPEYIDDLHRAAPLHDIGKVGIPDEILTKDGPLTDREFQIMRTHTTIGRQTLELAQAQTGPVPLLQLCIDIAYCHHEKWDGSGYPQGIAAEEIPLSARIIALADAYDAITSRRRYKAPVPHRKAVSIIQGDSGRHFAPDVVAAFAESLDDFDRIREEKASDAEDPLELILTGPG